MSDEEEVKHTYPLVHINGDGKPQYRASGLYACTSALVAARLGFDGQGAPEWLEERFEQGHTFEPIIMERARLRGFKRVDSQQMETRQNVGPAVIVGHIDGLGWGAPVVDSIDGVSLLPEHDGTKLFVLFGADDSVCLIDAKAFAPSTYTTWVRDRFKAFPYYAWQQSIYQKFLEMAMGRPVPIVMAVGLKDMEAAKNGEYKLLDFRMDVFTEPLVPFGQIMARVLEIERIAAGGIDAMPGKCDRPMFPCPFWSFPFHTAQENDVMIDERSIEGGIGELAKVADLRQAAYKRMKVAEAEVDEYDQVMKAAVGENVGSVKVGKVAELASSVTFYHAAYTTTNWDRVQKDYAGFDREKYQEKRPSTKLSVRVNPKRTREATDE